MTPNPAEVARQLRDLAATYELNSVEISRFLRNPGSPYPTSGLVRLMLRGEQIPSARFAYVLETRLAQLRAQLEAGVSVLTIKDQLKRVCHVSAEKHVTVLFHADSVDIDVDDLVRMLTALGRSRIRIATCDICGETFIATRVTQRICRTLDEHGGYPCQRESERRNEARLRAC